MNDHRINSLSIMMPTYNEGAVIQQVVQNACDEIFSQVRNPEFIIVNDGSTDNTLSVLQSLTKQYPYIKIINHEQNRGYGVSVMRGYHEAHGDYVFYMDSDKQMQTKDFWLLWENMQEENYDVVTGARTKRSDQWHRLVMTKTLQTLIKVFYKLSLQDINCPCKLFKSAALQKILKIMPKDSDITSTLLMLCAHAQGLRIGEVSVGHAKREAGQSYVSGLHLFTLSAHAINELTKLKYKFKKLKKRARV